MNINEDVINWNRDEVSKYIKTKLCDHVDTIREMTGLELNISGLCHALAKKGFSDSKPTVASYFNPEDPRMVRVDLLWEICTILGINISDVLPPQKTGHIGDIWKGSNDDIHSFKTRVSPFYEGEYYCYYFRPTHLLENVKRNRSETEDQPIRQGVLSLEHIETYTKACFREIELEKDYSKTHVLPSFELLGSAKYFVNMNQVYISLSEPNGHRNMEIMFPYIHLTKDVLYSQVAAVFNVSGNLHRLPTLQKMALFRKELDLQNEETSNILRGILSLNTNEILVEKEKFEKLVKELPAISEFPRNRELYYVFNESIIYDSPLSLDYTEKVELLMKLRNISSSPAIYSVSENERYNVFSRNFQYKQDRKK